MTIIEHLERHLGPIAEGWGTPISSDDQSRVRIVRFSNVPYDGAMTFCTVGHSDHVAEMDDGRTVRQELLFSTAGSYPADQVASFLLTLSSYLRSRTKALLRGEVIGPSAPVIPGVAANAVYASMPVIFPQGLEVYSESVPSTVLVWLVPLSASEAGFVRKEGWSRFEDLLEERNPDLLDLDRPSLVTIS
ncbi:suppressor of fused domain protein [Ralstonia sp. SM1864_UCD524_TZ4]|uniref:Conserved hypothethical protein n=2 Tax=Ralstonia solanacearum TaxID=305 RepID=A0A0S4XHV8_RALSL|nr:suppressor of fused domain protein [Ralstonia pseudosolanacearum]CUV24068.1 Conserved hypothethical protein [Ralstonia solanacearum]CUV37631.1 Conserved hypothethical protein [Ralstonia solanacearum]CUV62795.1 Conserved hypothethical protein [Ralstonia solanacearum]